MSDVARTPVAEPAEQGRDTCLTCGDVAIPMRVVRTGADGLADCVTEDGATAQVELALVDAGPGDEVLVHACVALQTLDDRSDAGRSHQDAGRMPRGGDR